MTLQPTEGGYRAVHNGSEYYGSTLSGAIKAATEPEINPHAMCDICEDNFHLEDLNDGLCDACNDCGDIFG